MSVVQPRFPQGQPSQHVELAAHRVLRKHRPRQGDVPLISRTTTARARESDSKGMGVKKCSEIPQNVGYMLRKNGGGKESGEQA